MTEEDLVLRDKLHFFGWDFSKRSVDRGDAGEIYVAKQAVDRAFHMTGVAEYLEFYGLG